MAVMLGLDCSHPISGAAVSSAGRGFVGRYVYQGAKGLTPAERDDLHAHGIGIFLFAETNVDDLTQSAAHAVALAQNADYEAGGLGAPAGTALAMCDDEDAPINRATVMTDMAAASAAIRGAGYLAAYYGSKTTARLLVAAKLIDVTFVVDTWGPALPDDAWDYRQLPNAGQITVGGVTCDQDEAEEPVGLWLPPVPLPPVPVVGTLEEITVRYPVNVPTDANGAGEAVLAQNWVNARGVFPNGSDSNGAPIARCSLSNHGGQIKVEVQGGVASGTELVFVAVAAN